MSFNSTQKSDFSQGVLPVWKYRSETLSDLLVRIRTAHDMPLDVPITYAGRLDPMADGLVLLLLGETCKEKQTYLDMDKTYHFTVLFGVSTDSYDVLGKVSEYRSIDTVSRDALLEAMTILSKETSWPYPPYSSRTIDGVPLFAHARNNTLPSDIPAKRGNIRHIELNDISHEKLSILIETIASDIEKITGDFRQEEIINSWNVVGDIDIGMASFTATVSSGVYIRSIAHMLGAKLGIPALAYSITRTKIGEYEITKPVI
jgi:tRNA pseudouridine55 synthase